ncbi:hypothetical protein RhiTH_010515 [Rhizoctonia solani]
MATCSQPPSRSQTQVYAGDMGSQLLPAPTLDKYNVKEATLEWVIHLLLGVQGQLDCLKQKIGEQAKAIKEVIPIVQGISQTINGIEARIPQAPQPSTPEDWKETPMVKETPQPAQNQGYHKRLSTWPLQAKLDPSLGSISPLPSNQSVPQCPPSILTIPSTHLHLPLQLQLQLPPTSYTAVKVDHPRPYKGKVGSKAKQWLTCMLAWVLAESEDVPHSGGNLIVPVDEYGQS